MASIFTKIITGEIPCYKIAETEDFLAFLDIRPRTKGHTLVIPKKEVDYIFDLDETTYLALMRFAKKIAAAVEKVADCERIAMAVIGLEVPHTHVHLIPIHAIGDVNFQKPAAELTPEEFQELATKIAAEV